MTQTKAALALLITAFLITAFLITAFFITACVCSPPVAWGALGDLGDERGNAVAQDVLLRMLQTQENLTSFEGTAGAKVYIGGRNVLTTSVGLVIERPNYVAVRWLGATIKPKHGLIFIDPQTFVSDDYTLSVLSAPARSGRDESTRSDRWIISAVSSGLHQPELSWTLYVDPDTWLIRRAQVVVGSSAVRTAIIEADYRQAGYRRWEPVRLTAQGRMVLEEFLPGFVVSLVTGRGDRGAGDEPSDSAPRVLLDFDAAHPGAHAARQSR